jgi:adenylate cyclase class 2
MYEVELKFPLEEAEAFARKLADLGARPAQLLEQADLYFNHPSRDFESTDEAIRVRTVNGRHVVTYKGPVVDSQTKTRREIEVALAGNDARDKAAEMLRFLGFRAVREVRKRRQTWHLAWQGRDFELALDQVDELGQFAEIETLADEAEKPAALAAIHSLVSQLQLPPAERKSYLCLLLEKDRQNR